MLVKQTKATMQTELRTSGYANFLSVVRLCCIFIYIPFNGADYLNAIVSSAGLILLRSQ